MEQSLRFDDGTPGAQGSRWKLPALQLPKRPSAVRRCGAFGGFLGSSWEEMGKSMMDILKKMGYKNGINGSINGSI